MIRSERGFVQGDEIPSTYGGHIKAYESSSAEHARIWVRVTSPVDLNQWARERENYTGEWDETAVHLNIEDAATLRDQLTELIDNHYMLWSVTDATEPVAILIVEGDDTTWVQAVPYPEWPFVVRIDDVLPSVLYDPDDYWMGTRELRVGDRVTLATLGASEYERALTLPFATATVEKIDHLDFVEVNGEPVHQITVTDVEELE